MRRPVGQCLIILALVLFLLAAITEKTALSQTITEHCGTITDDQFWSAGSTHLVTCDLTAPQGVTPTAEAGAVVQFQLYTQLNINGRLHAEGMVDAPIYFTSYRDDAVGGDSDDTTEFPAMGDCFNIQFRRSSDSSVLSSAVIRHSGDSLNCATNSALLLEGAIPDLSFISFQQNETNGATLRGDVNWSGHTLESSTVEQHWWGSDQGPPHDSNAVGTGDAISDGIVFDPWARDTCVTQIYSDSMPSQVTADLAVGFENIPETITTGNSLTFSLVITNHGPGGSPGFVLDFAVPHELLHVIELQFVPEDARPACYRMYEFTCMFAELESGDSVRAVVNMTMEEMTPQVLHFAATVDGGSEDTNPDNDFVTHQVELRSNAVGIYLPVVLR